MTQLITIPPNESQCKHKCPTCRVWYSHEPDTVYGCQFLKFKFCGSCEQREMFKTQAIRGIYIDGEFTPR